MAILLSTPEVVPPQEAITYDEIWMSSLTICATNPNAPVGVYITLDKCRSLEDGTKEIKPNSSIYVNFSDFFAEAALDPELLEIMVAIIGKAKAKAGI